MKHFLLTYAYLAMVDIGSSAGCNNLVAEKLDKHNLKLSTLTKKSIKSSCRPAKQSQFCRRGCSKKGRTSSCTHWCNPSYLMCTLSLCNSFTERFGSELPQQRFNVVTLVLDLLLWDGRIWQMPMLWKVRIQSQSFSTEEVWQVRLSVLIQM